MLNQTIKPEQGHRGKPDQHDGAEDAPDFSGSPALNREQQCDEGDRNGEDVGIEEIGGQRQSLDGAEHGNGRGDNAIAVEKGHAD